MKRFIAQLNDGSYINIKADSMELQGESNIFVYDNGKMVCYVDIDCTVSAHISDGGASTDKRLERNGYE